ncbi:MAG: hypothetical protein Q9191_008009 [Dirinaria sp. TL-2023a]
MSDIATLNREHWDTVARKYDEKPWQKKLLGQVTEDLREHRRWLGLNDLEASDETGGTKKVQVKLLDYACGPGTVSYALKPYLTASTGIDVSTNMVSEFNRRALEAHLPSFCAIVGDLCNPQGVAEELKDTALYDFDFAAIGLGFHHFEHLQLSIDRLVERLRVGGVLFIIDLLERTGDHGLGSDGKGDDFSKEAARTVPHKHGFGREAMKSMLQAAGCKDFDFIVFARPLVIGEGEGAFEKWGFVAKGTKV